MFRVKKENTIYKNAKKSTSKKVMKATPTIIGVGGAIEGGVFKSSTDVYVNGYFVGDIAIEGTIAIGMTGAVYGDILAKNAIISGNLKGNIKVTHNVHLKSSAVVEGTIDCMNTIIDEKAVFNGHFKMYSDIQLPASENILNSHLLE